MMEAERRNALTRKIGPIKKRLEKTENEIEAKESRKEEIEIMMADPDFYNDSERVKEVSLEYEALKSRLADLLNEWEDLAGRSEFAEAECDRETAGAV